MDIQLVNSNTGEVKNTPTGFSFTCLFFGGWVPILRGDWSSFFKLFGLAIITLGIYGIIFCFKYNKDYIQALIQKGFQPANEQAEMYLKMNALYLPTSS